MPHCSASLLDLLITEAQNISFSVKGFVCVKLELKEAFMFLGKRGKELCHLTCCSKPGVSHPYHTSP